MKLIRLTMFVAALDCSHSRLPYLYIEAIAKPRSFVSRRCESWDLFISCECNEQKTAVITFPPDARSADLSVRAGQVYL